MVVELSKTKRRELNPIRIIYIILKGLSHDKPFYF